MSVFDPRVSIVPAIVALIILILVCVVGLLDAVFALLAAFIGSLFAQAWAGCALLCALAGIVAFLCAVGGFVWLFSKRS